MGGKTTTIIKKKKKKKKIEELLAVCIEKLFLIGSRYFWHWGIERLLVTEITLSTLFDQVKPKPKPPSLWMQANMTSRRKRKHQINLREWNLASKFPGWGRVNEGSGGPVSHCSVITRPHAASMLYFMHFRLPLPDVEMLSRVCICVA
jgi:hypothetical protein